MSRRLSFLRLVALLIVVAGLMPRSARAVGQPSDNAAAIAGYLKDFAGRLDNVGSFEELGDVLPLSSLGLDDPDTLNLGDLLGPRFSTLCQAPDNCSTFDGLEAAIQNKALSGLPTDLNLQLNGVEVQENGDLIDISFQVVVNRQVNLPIAVQQNPLNLRGGSLVAVLQSAANFAFQLDTTLLQSNPDLAFYVLGTPTINLDAVADGSVGAITSQLGISTITVTGDAELNVGLSATFIDPDGDGRITKDEWTSTALEDLVTVGFDPATTAGATLNLNTDLIDTDGDPNKADTTITLQDLDLSNGVDLSFPTAQLGELISFANISANDLLSGLVQLASGLVSAQNFKDTKLPFLQQSLGDSFAFAEPLIALVKQQGDAFIACGTDGTTTPPSGDVSQLAAGDTVFCRAYGVETPSSVTWTIGDGSSDLPAVSGGADPNTLGTNPSANAQFTMPVAGRPQVKLAYVDSSGEHTVVPRFLTAQELGDKLVQLAGFDATEAKPKYDPATRSLTYHLVKTFDDPTPLVDGQVDFGDILKQDTNLLGLNPTGGAKAEIHANDIKLDITFGTILTPGVEAITPGDDATFAPSVDDRFFIQVDGTKHELAANADINATVELAGRIAFVDVTAAGPGFAVTRSDVNAPLLALDIDTDTDGDGTNDGIPVGTGAGSFSVPSAIRIRELLTTLDQHVDAACNVAAAGGLNVTAALGTTSATGGVTINWPDVFDDACAPDTTTLDVTPSADFTNNLKVFDINPDNPQELLSVILDNLETIAEQIDSLGGGDAAGLDTELPIVGTSPRDLVQQFKSLTKAIDEIRTGAQDADITCGTTDANPPEGDFKTAKAGDTIYCQALSSTADAVTAATWSTSTPGLTPGNNSTNAATVGTAGAAPGANAAFQVGPDARLGDFAVGVQYTDAQGTHAAAVPAAPPSSLKKLEETIESKLGLPPEALAFEFDDLPAPGSTTGDGVQDLVIRLGYGICTEGNTDAACATARFITRPTIPVKFDLGDGANGDRPGMIGVGSDSSVELDFAAVARLDLGIPLAAAFDAGDIVAIETSGVTLSAGFEAPDLNLTANVGPITVNLGTAANGGTGAGTAKFDATFALAQPGSDDTVANETFALGAYASGLDASFGGPVDPNSCDTIDQDGDPNTSDPLTLEGDGCARLSIGLGSEYLGDLGFLAPEIETPGDWQIIVPDNLDEKIANALLDWTLILEALEKLLENVESGLDGAASGVSLPLIGDALDGGANVAETIRSALFDPLSGGASASSLSADSVSLASLNPGQSLADALASATDAGTVRSTIQDAIVGAVGTSLLVDANNSGSGDSGDVTVTLRCTVGGSDGDCQDGDGVGTINDARITFALGQGDVDQARDGVECTDDGAVVLCKETPFDIGLDGLPLSASGNVKVGVGWKVMIDFGLSRNEGPYLVTGNNGDNQDPHGEDAEVQVGASVGLGDAACDPDDSNAQFSPSDTDQLGLNGYSDTRCLSGELGFLRVSIRDGANGDGQANTDDDPTNLSLRAALDVTGPAARVPFAEIASLGVDLKLEANANVDLRFRTLVNVDESSGLPSLLGSFHLQWGWTLDDDPGATLPTVVKFADLNLDAGAFVSQFLGPVVKEIKNISSPLKPVIDTVRARLPVISDLSELVGGEPVTLLSLMEALSGNDLSMLESAIAFLDFVNKLPTETSLLIPLGNSPGSFDVNTSQAKAGPVTPDKAGDLIQNPVSNQDGKIHQLLGIDDPDNAYGVPGLSFPFLGEGLQLFKVLMGGNVTLVRWDAGDMTATAAFGYSIGPIMAGPVPIVVTIGGSVTLKGAFAIGYDTVGLREVIDGGSPESLLNGVFIDDTDGKGFDRPEISLIGTVFVAAGVSVGVVEAGVEGGLRFTTDLNLDDSPDPDGKLRIQEIFQKLSNPICLFDVSGKLEAFLAVYVKIGFAFFDITFRFELVSITLLEFSAACEPPPPVLAYGDGTTLVLNMGSEARRNARAVASDKIDEKFLVRQMSLTLPGKFSVAAFGVYQEYCCFTQVQAEAEDGADQISLQAGVSENEAEVTCGATDGDQPSGGFNVSVGGTIYCQAIKNVPATSATWSIAGGTVVANATHAASVGPDPAQADNVAFTVDNAAGFIVSLRFTADTDNDAATPDETLTASIQADGEAVPIPFTAKAIVKGGADKDQIKSGDGADELWGDGDANAATDGDDKINAGGGDDTINGGGGADVLTGEIGTDYIYGDDNDDAVASGVEGNDSLSGGPGGDFLYGNEGNDEINGGPGSEKPAPGGGFTTAPNPDGDDLIAGGPGDDNIKDNFGSDTLYGDEELAGDAAAKCAAAGATPGGNDQVVGGAETDNIFGGQGNDTLVGEGGDDLVCGNDGADFVDGDDDASATADGDDTLNGGGDGDEIHGRGGEDDIVGKAGVDTIFGEAGNDDISGGAEGDIIDGGAGRDYIFGDDGIALRAVGTVDVAVTAGMFSETDGGADTMHGGADGDVMYGEGGADPMFGDANDDYMRGNGGGDNMRGGGDDDQMYGDADGDQMFGDSGSDTMLGNTGDDTMRGNAGDDFMQGNEDQDTIFGDAGQDDIIGGSRTAGALDTLDYLYGNADHDVLAGDNALIDRPGGAATFHPQEAVQVVLRSVTLLDIALAGGAVVSPDVSGGDVMNGNEGHDRMYGQGDDDTIHGNQSSDILEGNAGNDEVFGDEGQDDIVGGSSANAGDGVVSATSDATGLADGSDHLYGGSNGADLTADYDVLIGDNARIVRVVAQAPSLGLWQINAFNTSFVRTVRFFDMATLAPPTPVADTSSGDFIYGEGDDDLLYGQGGGDELHGGNGQDYMEGNAAGDTIFGDGGSDDMVGGTGAINGDVYPSGTNGRLDDADEMHGGPGFDVMAGDNALLERTEVDGQWVANTFNGGIRHELRILLDVEPADHPNVSGGDTMFGDAQDDLMYGQGDVDEMHGGDDDDFMEGNGAGDKMFGDPGQDDMLGGTIQTGRFDAGDEMHGGPDADVMLGDNGTIDRPLAGGLWQRLGASAPFGAIVKRVTTMAFNPLELAPAYGGDTMFGDAGEDDMYGQQGEDLMQGNAGQDAMVGDLGLIANSIETGSRAQHIEPRQPFLSDDIFVAGSLSRLVQLYAFNTAPGQGPVAIFKDRMLGGDGDDSMHGGAGDDIMNGDGDSLPDGLADADTEPDDPIPATDDEDHLFGGDGEDVAWGGRGHDHLWGGYGDDHLDVRPRPASGSSPADPAEWFTYGEPDNFQGIDYIYGGWDQDAMQANVGAPGPVPGDRLIDWVGAYNVYYLCPGLYGDYVVTRALDPGMVAFLQKLALGDGAFNTATANTSGFRETAIVFNNQAKNNASPIHPDTPGHFTCGAGVQTGGKASGTKVGGAANTPALSDASDRR